MKELRGLDIPDWNKERVQEIWSPRVEEELTRNHYGLKQVFNKYVDKRQLDE
jgi:hypothetical protein